MVMQTDKPRWVVSKKFGMFDYSLHRTIGYWTIEIQSHGINKLRINKPRINRV